MEQHTPYEPLLRAPLKLSGVFGMAWQLYKRGFWPMFAFVLILTSIDSLPAILINKTAQNGPGMGLSLLVSALSLLLIAPAKIAVLFMEMEERVAGRHGTFGQLFRYALPIGLRRFYSTYFAMLIMGMVAGIVMAIVLIGVCFIAFIPLGFASLSRLTPDYFASGTLPPEFIWIAVLMCAALLLFYTILSALIALIFPAAVHEGRRSFNAVSRGMRLTFKRLGRMLLYGVLYSVYLIAVAWLPLVILRQNTGVASDVARIVIWLLGALFAPYWGALSCALYVDSASRVDAADAIAASLPKPPPSPYYPAPQPQPGLQQPQSGVQLPPNTRPQQGVQPPSEKWVDTQAERQSDQQE